MFHALGVESPAAVLARRSRNDPATSERSDYHPPPLVDTPNRGSVSSRLERRQLEWHIERMTEQFQPLAAFVPGQQAKIDAGQDGNIEDDEPQPGSMSL